MSVAKNNTPRAGWMSMVLGGACLTLALTAPILIADTLSEVQDLQQADLADPGDAPGLRTDDSPVTAVVQAGYNGPDGDQPGGNWHDDDHVYPVVSINSTSQNHLDGAPLEPVQEQPFIDLNEFTVIAVNDLGIHCGDMDTRNVNILPPFNVLHAVVIQKGKFGPLVLERSTGQCRLFSGLQSQRPGPRPGADADPGWRRLQDQLLGRGGRWRL